VGTGDLHRLFDAGEYADCLQRGQTMLEQEDLSLHERARLHALLCRCRVEAGDLLGAVTDGEAAIDLAGQLGLPDLRGSALVDLAIALIGLRRYAEALDRLDQFQAGLSASTSARCLEGLALRLQGEALLAAGRPSDAAPRFAQARRWFDRFGDQASVGVCLLGELEAALDMADAPTAAAIIREGEAHYRAVPDDQPFLGRLLLLWARYHELGGKQQEAVNAAFQALELAEPLTPLQVEAQLHLSRLADQMNRPTDALSFAFAARVTAIDGRLYILEMRATGLFLRLLHRHGEAPLRELVRDLAREGIDLYQYVDPGELAHGRE